MGEGVGRGRGRGRGGGSFGAVVVAGFSLFGGGCDGTAGAGTGIDSSGLGRNQTMLGGVPLLGI
jgi:hypothetical protein